MKFFAVTTMLLFVLAAPLAAQDRTVDLTLWASRTDVRGTNVLNDAFETEFESGDGFGVSANVFLTNRFSIEAAVFDLGSEAELTFEDTAPFEMGNVDIRPFTAGVQFHPAGLSRIDPYVGAGLAYVMASDVESEDLRNLGVGALELENELTWQVNAGIGFSVYRGIGLAVDARYIPYEPKSRSSVTGGEEDLDLTTLVVSGGVRFRF